MDVMNNVWNAIITENEMLTKIITAPTVIIEAWLLFKLFTSVLKVSYTHKQEYLYIIILSLNSLIAEFIIPAPFNVIIDYLIIFIVLKILFKSNITKTMLYLITPLTIFALVGNLILNPILKLINITSVELNCIPVYRLTYLSTIYLICFLISIILKNMHFSTHLLDNLNENSKRIIILNLCLGLVTLFIQIIITFYYINTYSLIFTLLNFISLFAYFFISFYSLTKTMNLQVTMQNLESAEKYNNTLTYLYDNVKAFKHDFNNIIFIIGGYINTNDVDGLKKYYIDLEKDCERVNSIEILNPKIINNPGIYNLLIAKYNKAQHENVKISLEFFFDFERLNMPIYEFARILGILLDNSIEAATSCNEKNVNIMFRDSSSHKTQIIKIENTYTNKNVDIDHIFEKGVTEKKEHMGMGLWEINQIVKRNNNVKILTTKNDKYFIQQLEIYY